MSTIWGKRQSWDEQDRYEHLERVMKNLIVNPVYIDKGSFSEEGKGPEPTKSNDTPQNRGGPKAP